MLIEIDCRERELHQQCLAYLQQNTRIENVVMKTSNMPIGDIIIYDDSRGDKLIEKIIIERKSVNDLAASIRDSRYREQSFRLSDCSLHNHNIFYLIEGSFSNLGRRYNKNTLLSAMTSISYNKGFSLYRTFSVAESAEWIIRMADKIQRSKEKPYYSLERSEGKKEKGDEDVGGEDSEGKTIELADEFVNKMKSEEKDSAVHSSGGSSGGAAYSSVVKRVKKHNITKDNIGEIMLMQIPNVSAAAAQSIMSKYKTIPGLLHALKETPGALDEITIVTKANLIGSTETKKVRKISNTCKSNIYNYLLQETEEIITIDTK
jgi:ERCC4-type nuclease